MTEPPYPGEDSALVITVPAAEPVVGEWRRRCDPSAAWGVPAHVTILYPFIKPAAITRADLTTLRTVARRFESFELTFDSIGRFDDAVLYLRPHPATRLVELTEAMTAEWPDLPPYGGIHSEVIPHLTIAEQSDLVSFEEVALAVEADLPVHSAADAIDLIAGSYERDSWRRVARFDLAPPTAFEIDDGKRRT